MNYAQDKFLTFKRSISIACTLEEKDWIKKLFSINFFNSIQLQRLSLLAKQKLDWTLPIESLFLFVQFFLYFYKMFLLLLFFINPDMGMFQILFLFGKSSKLRSQDVFQNFKSRDVAQNCRDKMSQRFCETGFLLARTVSRYIWKEIEEFILRFVDVAQMFSNVTLYFSKSHQNVTIW